MPQLDPSKLERHLSYPENYPAKKPIRKIITNNEYLLKGFAAQFANLSTIFADDLYKTVF